MGDLADLWPAAIVFVLAGVVKGIVGLGLPTVAMALLAQTMSPAAAAALLIVPSFVTNVWQLRPWTALTTIAARFGPLQLGVCLGTWVGAWLFGAPTGTWAIAAVGVALVSYAAWGLSGAAVSIVSSHERWLAPLVGVITGGMTAATGVFVVPAVPYLQSLDLERDALIQAMGLSFTTSTVALAVALYANASYSPAALGQSTLMLAPAITGMYAGQWIRHRLSPVRFRFWFLLGLGVLGLHMLTRVLYGR